MITIFCIGILMPGPCSGWNLISNLVADYIQKRRRDPGLFSFEHNLLPKLISNFYALHGPGINAKKWIFPDAIKHKKQMFKFSEVQKSTREILHGHELGS